MSSAKRPGMRLRILNVDELHDSAWCLKSMFINMLFIEEKEFRKRPDILENRLSY
jgi:hypothetical protein